MKFEALRDTLLKPIQAVVGVVERRQTMPILANLLLTVTDGSLSVTATDLEVELVAKAEVEVKDKGEVTVPARKLLDICRALPEGSKVTVSLDRNVSPYVPAAAASPWPPCRQRNSPRWKTSRRSAASACRRSSSAGSSNRPISPWPSRTC